MAIERIYFITMHDQAGVNFENLTEVKFRDILLTGTGQRDRHLNWDSPGQTGTYGRSTLKVIPSTRGGSRQQVQGAISVICGSQVSLRVPYCIQRDEVYFTTVYREMYTSIQRDEVYFTTLLWQKNEQQNGLISRMLFSELYKIMVKKVTFLTLRRSGLLNLPPLWIHPCHPLHQNVICDLYW